MGPLCKVLPLIGFSDGHAIATMIRAVEACIYAVGCTMPSNRRGGTLGYVGSIMSRPQLLLQPGTAAQVDPLQPVQHLVIPNGTTPAAISVLLHRHTTDVEEFNQFIANMNIFLALLVDKVDNTLLGHLRNRTLNLSNVHQHPDIL